MKKKTKTVENTNNELLIIMLCFMLFFNRPYLPTTVINIYTKNMEINNDE